MKKRSTFSVEEFHARARRQRTGLQARIVRTTLMVAAIALLVALILVAEGRLSPDVRFGFFEATYASP